MLIIGPSNIGDAILMSGVVETLHRAHPGAHLTLVVGARATAVFRDDPRVHTLVDASLFDTLLGRLKLAVALWRYQPQAVVDLRHTLYPLLLQPLSAWRYLRRPPPTMRHMRDRHRWELSAQLASGSRGNGAVAHAEPMQSLWFSEKDAAHVDGLMKRWRLDGGSRIAVIAPGARSHIKRWTAEGFARVADRLIHEAAAHVIFSGEPEEEPIVEEILGMMRHRAVSAVGLVTVRQLGLLMRRAALVITNDSAALHLASAVQAPTLALFGPTDETKYGPTSPRRRVLRRRLFCAPCQQASCRFHHECMRFISADEVYSAAKELLEPRT